MLKERDTFHAPIKDTEPDTAQGESGLQDRVLTPDEIADLNMLESFPASDSPSFGISRLGAPTHEPKRSRAH